jgi:nucleoside-diphosphate-sugar epimerase
LNHKKKILIVGGTGFIGYHLAKESLKKKWHVTSVSSTSPKKIRYLKKVKYLICDITNKNSLKKILNNKFEYVVNLGGYVDHAKKKKTFKSHFNGCKNLAEIFLKKNLISFIQMGSSVEYGSIKSPQKENIHCDVKSIKSIYGKAKLQSSNYLMDLYKKKNFPSTVLRLYLAYGPKQDINRFLPIVIKGCIENKKIACSYGNQIRDFVFVKDVVDAIFKSLASKKARGQIINIGSGKPNKIKNIIQTIKKNCKGGHPQFGKIKLRKDEILKLYPSIKKAKIKINWIPKTSFKKGLAKTINFYNGKKF